MPHFTHCDPTGEPAMVSISIDDEVVRVAAGQSVAAAVLAHGLAWTRRTPLSDTPRAPLCMMGVCFECLMVIDDVPNRQACLVTVADGMRIRRQQGAGD